MADHLGVEQDHAHKHEGKEQSLKSVRPLRDEVRRRFGPMAKTFTGSVFERAGMLLWAKARLRDERARSEQTANSV